ncbi:hypothetical protein PCANC_16970 [Puccinia coronata f. sp. avenae]|uniref:HAT C-terminal dimerisation domain-containing protein n=1 Tax=Puccinia coronata f. sp. avenae TaxID=200324 RepID=A0A2N5SHM9_9BASI|nr:hypothetical protein PCANC_16970 [Puccinia coronata f. sp. avenae]
MLHPAWRLSLIEDKYPNIPAVAVQDLNIDDSDGDNCTYYPEKKGPSQEEDEIKKYKAGAWPLSKKGDPLQWWKLHLSEFPLLALIARDVLACSGTSATIERTFSAAADVCSSGRKSLTSATIERCVVVDEAEKKAKFATQVAKRSEPIKYHKIKHVAATAEK